ncbi:MAG: hypothetical protein KBC06_02220 [Candidatus Pacebacteria bacterium]|nr:hypothetical protein [Candidatus Paceibacterota bacterium]
MIHIEKDNGINDNANIKVATATGDYEDSALIEVYDISTPDIVAGAFQAQYIRYGNIVYGFNDPVELGRAILAVDPESTHTAASYVRMTEKLLAQMNSGTLEATSLDQVITDEQQKTEEKMIENENTEEEIPEEVEEVEEVTEEVPEEIVEENPEDIEVPAEAEVVEEVPPTEDNTESTTPPLVEEEVLPDAIDEVVPEIPTVTEPVSILRRKSKRKIV